MNSDDIACLTWKKSTRSNDAGECVEVATWTKSTRSSGSDNCVEVAGLPDGVAVRDSKDPHGAVLAFTPSEWTAFLGTAKSGTFDL